MQVFDTITMQIMAMQRAAVEKGAWPTHIRLHPDTLNFLDAAWRAEYPNQARDRLPLAVLVSDYGMLDFIPDKTVGVNRLPLYEDSTLLATHVIQRGTA